MALGIFTESMYVDVSVITMIVGGFATIIFMLASQRAHRAEEIEAAVTKIITASPEKIMVSPQPFVIEMKKEFVQKDDFHAAVGRITRLEERSRKDREELMTEIANVPAKTISLLKQVKGLL